MVKKAAKRSDDPEKLKAQLAQYEQIFGEVTHFIDLISRQETEIAAASTVVSEAKLKYDAAKDALAEAMDARSGTKHALFMYLKPGPAEILPLFDRMDPADEEKHGEHSDEWRKEPVSAMRLSLLATNLLTAADVIFVGQLQDRVQADAAEWWKSIEGITAPVAAAILDRLNDLISERSGK